VLRAGSLCKFRVFQQPASGVQSAIPQQDRVKTNPISGVTSGELACTALVNAARGLTKSYGSEHFKISNLAKHREALFHVGKNPQKWLFAPPSALS
jgi:hypothetical protein